MAEVNLPSWSEISQASEGLQLTSTAATWENILARLARIESRLLEHERRAASTRPPLRPEPDPPDGPLLYAAAQPQFQITCYQPPLPYTHQQQTHLNEYTQPHTSCNRVDWYNRSALIHGQPNHNPNFGGFPPHQFQQPQHEPNCQPSCWDPPKYQPPQGCPPDDQHPALQTSWWESPGNRVHLGFAQYGQPPFTNTESLNGPPMQYTTSTFGQSLYSSDMPPQNPYAGYHSGLPEYQSTPAPYQPPMDVEDVIEPRHENEFNLEPLLKQFVEIPRSTRIDGSVRVLYTEQGTIQQCLDKAREMKPTSDIQSSGLGEKTLPSENYIPGNVFIEGTQKQLESGSQSILSANETCVLLNEDTDESIEDAKDDHSDENGLLSVQNFFKYTKGEGKQLFRELDREGEWQVTRDLQGGDVARMNHRPTLLDGDARLIPPRNDTLYLSVLGRVDKLSILTLIFDNHMGPPLMIFDRDEEGRRFPIRCAFDPGGNSSPKLLFVKLFIVSWFPP